MRRGFSKDIWGTGLNSNKTSLRGCFISCFAYVEHILFQTSPPHMTCPIWVLEHHKRSTSWSTEDFLNLFCPNQLKRFQIWQGGHVKIKFTTSLIFLGIVTQWPEGLFVEFEANLICIEFVLEFIVQLIRPNVSERHIGLKETRDVHHFKRF